jgi:hypothetical protein
MTGKKLIAMYVLGIITGAFVGTGVNLSMAQTGKPGVTGIGGVFFKADNPVQLRAWYQRNLGIDVTPQGVNFFWRQAEDASRYGLTVWSLFPRETEYFGPGKQDFMINYRVGNLDAMLESLRSNGVEQVGDVEDYSYGRFAWILDGEGNRVELWEPVDFSPEEFSRQAQDGNGQ